MSTPRTDAEAKYVYGHVDRLWVSEHFARQLETELNEALLESKGQWCAFCGKMGNHTSGSCYALANGIADRLKQERDEANERLKVAFMQGCSFGIATVCTDEDRDAEAERLLANGTLGIKTP